jgi:1-acyl-sn-glycerol-3-phosphate acyltransferase
MGQPHPLFFMQPNYIYPRPFITRIMLSICLGRRRSFHRDALAMTGFQKPSFSIMGRENIPTTGPGVVTFNHYHRPGFQAWWLALGIASVVEQEMHWVVTGELTCPGDWYGFLGRPLSRWALRKAAHSYGFTLMPPMPPRPQDAAARAFAVREVLSKVKQDRNLLLGLAPEGGDNPDGAVLMPAAGAGRFGLLLASTGMTFTPVGAFEQNGAFCLHFGPPYTLAVPAGLPTAEKDHQAARLMMQNIANLLPSSLRGEFH